MHQACQGIHIRRLEGVTVHPLLHQTGRARLARYQDLAPRQECFVGHRTEGLLHTRQYEDIRQHIPGKQGIALQAPGEEDIQLQAIRQAHQAVLLGSLAHDDKHVLALVHPGKGMEDGLHILQRHEPAHEQEDVLARHAMPVAQLPTPVHYLGITPAHRPLVLNDGKAESLSVMRPVPSLHPRLHHHDVVHLRGKQFPRPPVPARELPALRHHRVAVIAKAHHPVSPPLEETVQEHHQRTQGELLGEHHIGTELVQVLPVAHGEGTPAPAKPLLQVEGAETETGIKLVIIKCLVAQVPIPQTDTGTERIVQRIEEIDAIRRNGRMKNQKSCHNIYIGKGLTNASTTGR